ncbi:MAG: histidine kinase [Saprospiraceae bacterium]|nr:histidine kinase [Saprospiraceae bacterium]
MMMLRRIFFMVVLATCQVLQAQEPAYLHYGVSDGLPSSLVYTIAQDHQGFLWFGTDKGMARFDGTRFKIFSIKHGLPDNDVLNIFEDHQKRLWLSCFQNNPCYFQDGKIVTSKTDHMLAKMDLKGGVFNFSEDSDSSLWITGDANKYCRIGNSDELEVFKSPFWAFDETTESGKNKRLVTVKNVVKLRDRLFATGHKITILDITNQDSIFKSFEYGSKTESDVLNSVVTIGDYMLAVLKETMLLFRFDGTAIHLVDTRNDISGTLVKKDNLGRIWVCSQKHGAVCFDGEGPDLLINPRFYLLGKKVTSMHQDSDGNLWFGTLNEGVYMLPQNASLRYTKESGLPFNSNNIISLNRSSTNELMAGDDSGNLYIFNRKRGWKRIDFGTTDGYNRVLQVLSPPENQWLAISEEGVYSSKYGKIKNLQNHGAPKSGYFANGQLWLGTSGFLVHFHNILGEAQRIMFQRTTSICADAEGNIWAGGLNGIFSQSDNFKRNWGEKFPMLSKRILDIKEAGKNALWVASSEYGLLRVQVKQGTLTKVDAINESLSSPIENIQNIHPGTEGQVWLATNNGVYTIDEQNRVKRLSDINGLISNNVNAVMLTGDTLWVATVDGISHFILGKNSVTKDFPTLVSGLRYTANQDKVGLDFYELDSMKNQVTLPANATMLVVDLAALHFRTRGNVFYEFSTVEHFLPLHLITWRNLFNAVDYLLNRRGKLSVIEGDARNYGLNLKAGSYQSRIAAILPNGTKSETPVILHLIQKPYWWQVIWVHIVLAILVGMGFYRLFKARERMLKLQNANSELQLQAIRAQMNPHFVGNSINAIQQFFYPPDPIKASEYIAIFSDLLRQTMYFSERDFISFEEELAYVQDYLKMIQLRFGARFHYEITGHEQVEKTTSFPAMLLQPVLENATIHGLAPEGPSNLHVHFECNQNRIFCSIQDNGVGIEASKARKLKKAGVKRVSKGLILLKKKIETMNELYAADLQLTFKDLSQVTEGLSGTQVVLSFVPIKPLAEINVNYS